MAFMLMMMGGFVVVAVFPYHAVAVAATWALRPWIQPVERPDRGSDQHPA